MSSLELLPLERLNVLIGISKASVVERLNVSFYFVPLFKTTETVYAFQESICRILGD
jgi:hypothetical protein